MERKMCLFMLTSMDFKPETAYKQLIYDTRLAILSFQGVKIKKNKKKSRVYVIIFSSCSKKIIQLLATFLDSLSIQLKFLLLFCGFELSNLRALVIESLYFAFVAFTAIKFLLIAVQSAIDFFSSLS
jgi:hypothetical protein